MSQRLYETAVAVLGPDALLAAGDDARGRRRAVGARAAGVARQLDHGRHERDPAQHHRRAAARAAARAEARDDRPASTCSTSSTPSATRARRLPARRCGRGCGPRRRSRTSRREGYEPFWAITKHADILRDLEAAAALLERAGDHAAPRRRRRSPPSEMVVMLDPPRHGPVRRVANARFTPRAVRGAARRHRAHRGRDPRRGGARRRRRASSTSSSASPRRSRSR